MPCLLDAVEVLAMPAKMHGRRYPIQKQAYPHLDAELPFPFSIVVAGQAAYLGAQENASRYRPRLQRQQRRRQEHARAGQAAGPGPVPNGTTEFQVHSIPGGTQRGVLPNVGSLGSRVSYICLLRPGREGYRASKK